MYKLFLISIFLNILFSCSPKGNKNESIQAQVDSIKKADSIILSNAHILPNDKELYRVSKEILGNFSRLFIAIKIVESGRDYEVSKLAKNYHNLLGMKVPKSRFTYAKSKTKGGYAVYDNWLDCIYDFKMLIQMLERKKIKRTGKGFETEQDLLNSLAQGFNNYRFWSEKVVKVSSEFGGNLVVPDINFTPYNEVGDTIESMVDSIMPIDISTMDTSTVID